MECPDYCTVWLWTDSNNRSVKMFQSSDADLSPSWSTDKYRPLATDDITKQNKEQKGGKIVINP